MPESDEASTVPQTGESPHDAQPAEVEGGALSDIPLEPDPETKSAHSSDTTDDPSASAPAKETQPEAAAEPPPPPPPRLSRADRDAYERQRRRFAACGRCGYFVADCRLYLGEPALQSAILAADDGWLRLEGDATLGKLAMDAYGVQLDMAFDLFDGICPECRRRYVLVNTDSGITRLKIQL